MCRSHYGFHRTRRQPPVEQPGPVPPFTGRWRPQPPAVQKMPVQEPGVRPARPLPYQPDASATTGPGPGSVTVALSNRGKASAHFALYPYAGGFAVPRHRGVRGGCGVDRPRSG